ncbi:MAG: alpha/beta fold hydrolase [Legionellales bacterium]|nr:alpha/beta fold hydrolase [Legionellales bacterium]
MLTTFPEKTTAFQLPSPVGELEVVVEIPLTSSAKTTQLTAIVCHPHPLHGGTMNNKVVSTMMKALLELGIPAVRFNFRGIGKSTGIYGEGVGEIQDLETVIDWVKQTRPGTTLWLGGFSFGTYISAAIAARGDVARLISIAPPIMHMNFQSIAKMPCPWLVIQGDADEVFDAEEVFTWFAEKHPEADVVRMKAASHFFHGRLVELRENLISKLSE